MCKYRKYFASDSIIAPARISRPMIGKQEVTCPFCIGNEQELEKIYDEVWEENKLFVRILANKYPVIGTIGDYTGVHDVIVDTENHLEHPKDFSARHWQVLLLTLQRRWQQLSDDEQNVFIQIFKNYGDLAGASIYHSHWQLLAMHQVPYSMMRQYELYERDEQCFLCQKVHLKEAIIVYETLLWQIIVPPSPEFNYEVWLIPKSHRQHYGELTRLEIEELGTLFKRLLMSYHEIMPDEAFNICMMSGDLKKVWHYHFHVKLMMRIGHIAGFEIATHCHIMMVDPKIYALKIKQLLEG